MMYGYGNTPGGGLAGGLMMWFFGALILVGIVLVVVWIVRSASGPQHTAAGGVPASSTAGHDEAVAIAKRRLAGGEITKDEYDELMRTLAG